MNLRLKVLKTLFPNTDSLGFYPLVYFRSLPFGYALVFSRMCLDIQPSHGSTKEC